MRFIKRKRMLSKTHNVIIIISILFITELTFSQCTINNDYYLATDFTQIINPQSFGQSFEAECDGNIEYFEISETIDTNFYGSSEGLIQIYDGTNINSTPIYTETYEWVTLPFRFVISDNIQLSLGSTYTIIVTISDLELTLSGSNDNNYTLGSAIIDNNFQTNIDLAFSVLISDPNNNCNFGNEYLDFPDAESGHGQNWLLIYKFNLDSAGTMIGLGFTGINYSNSNIKMAIYDDLNNAPDNLLTETGIGEVNNGIQILPVTPISLSPGVYWIAFVTDSPYYVYDWKTTCYQPVERYAVHINSFNNNLPNPYTGGEYITDACKPPIFAKMTCNLLDINEYNHIDLKIFPNPTSEKIYTNGLSYITKYTIFSLEGKIIDIGTIDDDDSIDVTYLNNGFYILKFEDGLIFKFLKN